MKYGRIWRQLVKDRLAGGSGDRMHVSKARSDPLPRLGSTSNRMAITKIQPSLFRYREASYASWYGLA